MKLLPIGTVVKLEDMVKTGAKKT
ncbi:Protein of unknown function [Bacillus cereus]|nr:Protein of unknown function [Bacillus cereus]SCN31154.1 Protein of unknown function [Bacillus wiedmannii]